jgi:hypothetical protein
MITDAQPVFLPMASLGSALTAVISSVDMHSAAVFASAVATIFAAVASVLRGRRIERKKQKVARAKRAGRQPAEAPETTK